METNNFRKLVEFIEKDPFIGGLSKLNLLQASVWYSPANKEWQFFHPDLGPTFSAATVIDLIDIAVEKAIEWCNLNDIPQEESEIK